MNVHALSDYQPNLVRAIICKKSNLELNGLSLELDNDMLYTIKEGAHQSAQTCFGYRPCRQVGIAEWEGITRSVRILSLQTDASLVCASIEMFCE